MVFLILILFIPLINTCQIHQHNNFKYFTFLNFKQEFCNSSKTIERKFLNKCIPSKNNKYLLLINLIKGQIYYQIYNTQSHKIILNNMFKKNHNLLYDFENNQSLNLYINQNNLFQNYFDNFENIINSAFIFDILYIPNQKFILVKKS
jgi:hypothetical protein